MLEELQINSLGTIVGIALITKLFLVPFTKWALVGRINGRKTVWVALGAGIILSLLYRIVTGPVALSNLFEGAFYGLVGAWAGIGIQQTVAAVLRPEKV